MEAPSSVPHVDEELLATLEEGFAALAGSDGRIAPAALQRTLGLRSEYLARRVFDLFDRDGDGTIDRDEFLDRVRSLVFGTRQQKLRFVFRLHDHDGDGFISRQELRRMICLSLAEDEIELDDATVDRLVGEFTRDADTNRDGVIAFEEFERMVEATPGLLDRITRSEAKWIAPNEALLRRLEAGELGWWPRVTARFDGRGQFVFWGAVWLLVNAALFAHAVWRYRAAGANTLVQVARGGGACLNLNGALILLPMMRGLGTAMRKSFVAELAPVDESVDIHRVIGHAMFGFALLHAAAHLANDALGSHPFVDQLFFTKAGSTGLVLLAVFVPMWVCAREAVRRSGKFELFYFSHLLYVAWFGFALAHGPVFWMWTAAPLAGYVAERALRRRRRAQETSVVSGHALRSGVTRLEILRPPGFSHRAGDYVFLRIPELARFEWHPFTISSAPEKPNLTVHVRTLGNWTSALRRLVEGKHAAGDGRPLRCHVDGPYGTPSNHIFESRRAVLVGAGIGVTPFAAILESILMRAHSGAPSALERVHFVWLNRDAYAFEWFGALLARLEREDRSGLLDVRIFMTSGRSDMTSGALELARSVLAARGESDIVTGLRARTTFGAPDWDALLGEIAAEHAPHPVDLYFCGPPALGARVRDACARRQLTFRMEHF